MAAELSPITSALRPGAQEGPAARAPSLTSPPGAPSEAAAESCAYSLLTAKPVPLGPGADVGFSSGVRNVCCVLGTEVRLVNQSLRAGVACVRKSEEECAETVSHS